MLKDISNANDIFTLYLSNADLVIVYLASKNITTFWSFPVNFAKILRILNILQLAASENECTK